MFTSLSLATLSNEQLIKIIYYTKRIISYRGYLDIHNPTALREFSLDKLSSDELNIVCSVIREIEDMASKPIESISPEVLDQHLDKLSDLLDSKLAVT